MHANIKHAYVLGNDINTARCTDKCPDCSTRWISSIQSARTALSGWKTELARFSAARGWHATRQVSAAETGVTRPGAGVPRDLWVITRTARPARADGGVRDVASVSTAQPKCDLITVRGPSGVDGRQRRGPVSATSAARRGIPYNYM